MEREEFDLMILVKAAPVLTSALQETMCVAAMSLDESPRWIRLHPVPFRDLDDDKKFRKYQEIYVRATRPKSDRRPESWTPVQGSIQIHGTVGTEHGWSKRRERIARLGEWTMCELIHANRGGSGSGIPSLGVVRTLEPPQLLITERDAEQLGEWRRRAAAVAAQPSLFDDPTHRKPDFEVIPWRFRYRYRCLDPACNGHTQTIVDWEAVALYRKTRNKPNWQDLMRHKFVDELWAGNRDTVLFVGNMEQRPWNFLVLGIFWPPGEGLQTSLIN